MTDFKELREALEAGPTLANAGTIRSLLDWLEAAERDAARYRWLRDIDSDPACSLVQLGKAVADAIRREFGEVSNG